MASELSLIDSKILKIVQHQGKISLQELAEKCNTSTATCWRRLCNLEEAGIITGYHAVIDRRKLGLDICALVFLSIEHQYKQAVKEIELMIENRVEVLECYRTTGSSDFTLRIVARDIASYDKFIQDFLFALPGVSNVQSNIVLSEIKYTSHLPI